MSEYFSDEHQNSRKSEASKMEFSELSATQEFHSAFIQTPEINNIPEDNSYSDPVSLADPLKLTESESVCELSFTLQLNDDFKEESKQGSKMVSTIG